MADKGTGLEDLMKIIAVMQTGKGLGGEAESQIRTQETVTIDQEDRFPRGRRRPLRPLDRALEVVGSRIRVAESTEGVPADQHVRCLLHRGQLQWAGHHPSPPP